MKSLSLKSPDTYIINWYRKLSSTVKTAFYSAVILGLFAHLYQFTNKLYNYDELANTPGGIGLSTEQGRWLLNWMGRFMRSVSEGRIRCRSLTVYLPFCFWHCRLRLWFPR